MGKTYIVPSVRMVDCESEELMKASGVYSDQGIRYGGVDNTGEREADSRRGRGMWIDDED
jgi:hypothetical protein